MSWVTDVLLLFSLEELYSDKNERIEEALPLSHINNWLSHHGCEATLTNLGQYAGGDKFMQACVYGGSFNFLSLKIDEFMELLDEQDWKKPENVQLLIKDELDERFTMYTLSVNSLRRLG